MPSERKNINQARRERDSAQKQFEVTFDANPAPSVIIRLADGVVMKASSALPEITGRANHTVEGKRVSDLDLFSSVDEFERILEALKQGESIPKLEIRLRSTTRGERYTVMGAKPIELLTDACGIFTFADVTELKQAEELFVQVFRLTPIPIALSDANDTFIDVNRSFEALTGYNHDEVVGRSNLELKMWSSRNNLEQIDDALKEQGEFRELELTLHTKEGHARQISSSGKKLTVNGAVVLLHIFIDVTDRRRAEQSLRANEQRMALHVKRTPLAVIEWRLTDHFITAWNPAAERIFGYRADEVVGLRNLALLLAEDNPELQAVIEGRSESSNRSHTNRNRTKDRRVILCEWYNTLLIDEAGEVTGGAALVMDVTLRQRAIEALLSAQDEERVRISRDLHDGVGQALTAISLALTRAQETPGPLRLGDLKELVAQTLEDVRRISRDLRPALLDELGLEAAVKQFARELSERSLIEIDVLVLLPQRLPRNEEAAVYRLIQEALTNVAKHAQATHASVVLTASDKRLHLVVEDDGTGFDVAELSTKSGVGLLGMRERVGLLGGVLRLESAPARGTIISIRMPLQKQL